MRYILGVLAVVIILFASIFWIITSRPDGDPEVTGDAQLELLDYADSGASVIYNVSGEIVAEEEHRQIRITVNRNQKTLDVISGYDGKVIKSQTFSNTSDAFEEFIHAIDIAGFTNEQNAEYESIMGVCPKGRRSEYVVREGGEELSRLWSTTCSASDGSFAGDSDLIEDLFEAQIPEYRQLTRGISL